MTPTGTYRARMAIRLAVLVLFAAGVAMLLVRRAWLAGRLAMRAVAVRVAALATLVHSALLATAEDAVDVATPAVRAADGAGTRHRVR